MEKIYKLVMFIILVGFMSCNTYNDIPLTEGSSPYALKPGTYIDVKGGIHNEREPRWSISEADLFRDTQNLEVASTHKFDYTNMTKEPIVVIIMTLCAMFIVKRILG